MENIITYLNKSISCQKMKISLHLKKSIERLEINVNKISQNKDKKI